jgi:hypothetical protein
MEGGIFFRDEKLDKQPLEPGVGIPVDPAEVIPHRIRPEIGKLDRLPAPAAAPLAWHRAAGSLPEDQGQALKPAEESLAKQAF